MVRVSVAAQPANTLAPITAAADNIRKLFMEDSCHFECQVAFSGGMHADYLAHLKSTIDVGQV